MIYLRQVPPICPVTCMEGLTGGRVCVLYLAVPRPQGLTFPHSYRGTEANRKKRNHHTASRDDRGLTREDTESYGEAL
ncbi:hypothetical protein E2C01_054797 [Portunus trituberculatus]|uniref:Uncharacterized protein n=1 Tax=Portunus trituberculatus TaxID=210409 RepID=A0A5B7GKS6_PORTR|nr:hypothetical protein [Portunus trituberculatus]